MSIRNIHKDLGVLIIAASAFFAPTVLAQSSTPSINTTSLAAKASPVHAKLRASAFLPPKWMSSPLHRVDPVALSNGTANTYIIHTPRGTHHVRGTAFARKRIYEIVATEQFRGKSTLGAAANSAARRTYRLFTTPFRVLDMVGNRIADVDNIEDALFFLPETTGIVAGGLVTGVGELGATGLRLIEGGSGAKCDAWECVEDISQDIWSGTHSVIGKHARARYLHKKQGTDPETGNPQLKKQVDRLAYTDAYAGVVYQIASPVSALSALDDYRFVAGVHKYGEFVTDYQDAHHLKKRDKASLKSWGLNQTDQRALYKNDAFTNAMRAELVERLRYLDNNTLRAGLAAQAAQVQTPYDAYSQIQDIGYLANIARQKHLNGVFHGTPRPVAVTTNGVLVMPVVGDFLQPTKELQDAVKFLSRTSAQNPHYTRAEIHVMGQPSQALKHMAKQHNVSVYTVT